LLAKLSELRVDQAPAPHKPLLVNVEDEFEVDLRDV
jgi:hypothetical protein